MSDSVSNFERRLEELFGPCEWGQDLSPEEQDAYHEDVERRRANLPERFKGCSEAIQNMFIIHGVDLT